MKNRIIYLLFLLSILNITLTQVRPYIEPNSFNNDLFKHILLMFVLTYILIMIFKYIS